MPLAQRNEVTILPIELQRKFERSSESSIRARNLAANGMYAYIPLHHEEFTRIIDKHLKPSMRVVDIGCGAGDKLEMFKLLGKRLEITGIEYFPTLARRAKELCPYATIIRGDAREQDYSQYDLLYMYRPMCRERDQSALQYHVMRSMRVGATLVVSCGACYHVAASRKFPDLCAGWVKPEGFRLINLKKVPESYVRWYREEK